MFFQIIVAKAGTGHFFLRNNSLRTVQISSKFRRDHGCNILMQKFVLNEWEQICQFSLRAKQRKAMQLS